MNDDDIKITINEFGKSFSKNGKLHREDGPAVEWTNSYKFWYKEGKLHREDGPAIEGLDGKKEWWVNNLRHRIDGPAVEWADGGKEYWFHGINIDKLYFIFTKMKSICYRHRI